MCQLSEYHVHSVYVCTTEFINWINVSIKISLLTYLYPFQSRLFMKNNCFSLMSMDQITIKAQNPKCRLYRCLIEFIDWRYSQSCWYFRPLLWTSAPHWLTSPPPSLCEYCKYRGRYFHTECNRGKWDQVVWRASTGVNHCVFDQIPNLQNCFTTPNKILGREGASDR